MAQKLYALARGETKRLRVKYGMLWSNTTIDLDGQELARFDGKRDLAKGREFILPNGDKLYVRLERNRLQLRRNNMPLPGSAGDDGLKFTAAYASIFFVAGISLIFGLIGLSSPPSLVQQGLSGGYISIGGGLVFAVLGFFVIRRSRPALWIAIILYALDLLTLILALVQGQSLVIVNIIVHLLFLWAMYQGFRGLDALEYEANATRRQTSVGLPPVDYDAIGRLNKN